jgi:hypothetical protein
MRDGVVVSYRRKAHFGCILPCAIVFVAAMVGMGAWFRTIIQEASRFRTWRVDNVVTVVMHEPGVYSFRIRGYP